MHGVLHIVQNQEIHCRERHNLKEQSLIILHSAIACIYHFIMHDMKTQTAHAT